MVSLKEKLWVFVSMFSCNFFLEIASTVPDPQGLPSWKTGQRPWNPCHALAVSHGLTTGIAGSRGHLQISNSTKANQSSHAGTRTLINLDSQRAGQD